MQCQMSLACSQCAAADSEDETGAHNSFRAIIGSYCYTNIS